jgi:type I restriction enzyme R subunit
MGALPNAVFIGFTGTPIDRTAHGKGTFAVFGGGDPGGYLDKYSIRESIEDGTTVPLHYQIAPNDLVVDRAAMEQEFWTVASLEGVADVEELNRVLERAVTLKNMLKNRDRVDKIARFVAEHYRNTIEPSGYKAFVVAVDREACCLYKEALDRYLPPHASQVVISSAQNDPSFMRRYYLSNDEEARVRKAFRKPDENPQILIVTEKLLTGYDAPILYCMYLDKPMRDHVLLQAIARVNRPYEDSDGRRKSCGLIVDFVGIFDNLEKALAFDSADLQGVVEGIDTLKQRFHELIQHGRERYLSLLEGKDADHAAEAVLEHFRDQDARQAFYAYFRELQEIYEILSPAPFLRPFLDDYQKLAAMYQMLLNTFEPQVQADRALLRKTAEIVARHTSTDAVGSPDSTYVIDAETLRALVLQDKPDIVKVFNLLKEVQRLVDAHAHEEPYLIPIGERAEAIREAFAQRQLDTKEALEQAIELVGNLQNVQKQRERSSLSPEAFAVATWLQVQKGFDAERAEDLAASLEPTLANYPHWAMSARQKQELRMELYNKLMDAGIDSQECSGWIDELFRWLQRMHP